MARPRVYSRFIVAVLILAVCWPTPAAAYLDPGTGSLILQGIIGTVVGALVAVKLYWARIKRWFAGPSETEGREDGTADDRR